VVRSDRAGSYLLAASGTQHIYAEDSLQWSPGAPAS